MFKNLEGGGVTEGGAAGEQGEVTGGWVLLTQQSRPGSGRRGMMDTADHPVRKFRGKEEEVPALGH